MAYSDRTSLYVTRNLTVGLARTVSQQVSLRRDVYLMYGVLVYPVLGVLALAFRG